MLFSGGGQKPDAVEHTPQWPRMATGRSAGTTARPFKSAAPLAASPASSSTAATNPTSTPSWAAAEGRARCRGGRVWATCPPFEPTAQGRARCRGASQPAVPRGRDQQWQDRSKRILVLVLLRAVLLNTNLLQRALRVCHLPISICKSPSPVRSSKVLLQKLSPSSHKSSKIIPESMCRSPYPARY